MKTALLALSIGVLVVSCKPKDDQKESTVPPTVVDSTITTYRNSDEPKEYRYWSSQDTGLPMGTVVKMDCADCQTDSPKISDNYVTIKGPDGVLCVTSDINEDVYLNLEIGDIVKY